MSALKALEGVDARVDAYKLRGERMDGRIVGEPEEVRKSISAFDSSHALCLSRAPSHACGTRR